MRRKVTYTVNPPAEGKHIAYCREDRQWIGFFDGAPVIESASDNPETTRARLDAHVYDLLTMRARRAAA